MASRIRAGWYLGRAVVCASLLLVIASFHPSTASAQDQPTTWEAFDARAAALAPVVSALAAEISDGTCRPVHELNADLTTPIGSGFKLYILAEIAAAVEEGRLTWEQPVTIRKDLKSIPGGPLLFVPDGSVFTLRYLAEQMIQRSDNTATDTLLFLAGRENIERRMAEAGHHDASLNTPLPATREFAVIKFLWSDEELERYRQASDDAKREMLAGERRGFPALSAFFDEHGDQDKPVRVETVEWFANRHDICNLFLALNAMGGKPELRPLLEVLTLNDPIGFDREKWTYVGFKGGSEMGLQAGNWMVRRDDGRLFVFTAAFLDPDQALDLASIVPLLEAAPDLLHGEP